MKLWDVEYGTTETEKRDLGMKRAADNNQNALQTAKMTARAIAAASFDHTCDIDRVRRRMALEGFEGDFGNWAGSVFKGGEWEEAGMVKCDHEGSHSRRVVLWRLK